MKIWVDRESCEVNPSFCLSCFERLVQTGAPDQPCIIHFEDDGKDTLTVYEYIDGEDRELMVVLPGKRSDVGF